MHQSRSRNLKMLISSNSCNLRTNSSNCWKRFRNVPKLKSLNCRLEIKSLSVRRRDSLRRTSFSTNRRWPSKALSKSDLRKHLKLNKESRMRLTPLSQKETSDMQSFKDSSIRSVMATNRSLRILMGRGPSLKPSKPSNSLLSRRRELNGSRRSRICKIRRMMQ